MTKVQAVSLMRFYVGRIRSHYNNILVDDIQSFELRHLISMPDRVTEAFSQEKAMRWLGFMQGALWILRWYSLEELKEHGRKASENAFIF